MIPSIHGNRLRFGTLSAGNLCSWGTISLAFLLKGIHTPLLRVYHEMADTCRCEHGTKLEVVSAVVSDREGVQGPRGCASQQIHALYSPLIARVVVWPRQVCYPDQRIPWHSFSPTGGVSD